MEEMELARRLKFERASKGLTQEELAKASGVTATTIALIETNRVAHPQPKTIIALATALGVDPQEWL